MRNTLLGFDCTLFYILGDRFKGPDTFETIDLKRGEKYKVCLEFEAIFDQFGENHLNFVNSLDDIKGYSFPIDCVQFIRCLVDEK